MVKVLDPNPHKSVVAEHICKNCGATLEYVPKDIQERKISDYTGDTDVVQYIVCPQCSDKQTVRY